MPQFKIVNVNFAGEYTGSLEDLPSFRVHPPIMVVVRMTNGLTLLVFKTRKCRIMGATSTNISIPDYITNVRLQSMTITFNLGHTVNLIGMHEANLSSTGYEAEIFPALHLRQYHPIHVNIFASGRVVLTGVKTHHDISHIVDDISEFCIDYM
jgi:TATA-box binding protein (TBP) (component of TFIID and TFIIIB)